MTDGRFEVISDDYFMACGLLHLLNAVYSQLPPGNIVLIDIDRVRSPADIDEYMRRVPSDAVILAISRNGILSRLFQELPCFDIDTPVDRIVEAFRSRTVFSASPSVWRARCRRLRTGQGLTEAQIAVLSWLRRGAGLHVISRAAGIRDKTCYSQLSSITSHLKLRNLTELRYFATHMYVA